MFIFHHRHRHRSRRHRSRRGYRCLFLLHHIHYHHHLLFILLPSLQAGSNAVANQLILSSVIGGRQTSSGRSQSLRRF